MKVMRYLTILLTSILLLAGGRVDARIIRLDQEVKECSTAFITMDFKDRAGNLVQPYSYSFWVKDRDTGYNLWPVPLTTNAYNVGPTPGPQASTYVLNIGSSGQRIVTNTKDREWHVVSVNFKYGSDCATGTDCVNVDDEIEYPVVNLRYGECNPRADGTPTYGFTPSTPAPTLTQTPTATVTRTPTATPTGS